MLNLKSFCIVALVCYAAAFSGAVKTQTDAIQIKFEVDGEESHQPFKIFLSVEGGAIFEPPISDNGFVLPPELRGAGKLHLRLESDKYDLDYGEVNFSKFSGEMIFGIDTKPFAEENLPTNPPPDKELVGIYYIRFEPNKGAATRLVIHEYR